MYGNCKYLIMGILATAFILAPVGHARAQDPPDTVQLGVLAHLYEPVHFDHAMHIEVAACSECHHHGAGAPVQDKNCARCHGSSEPREIQACQACHAPDPFTAELINQKELDVTRYHRDMPGLKGAFHQNCLGCHAEMGAPTDCQDCHARTEAGDAFFHAGPFAPTGNSGGQGGH